MNHRVLRTFSFLFDENHNFIDEKSELNGVNQINEIIKIIPLSSQKSQFNKNSDLHFLEIINYLTVFRNYSKEEKIKMYYQYKKGEIHKVWDSIINKVENIHNIPKNQILILLNNNIEELQYNKKNKIY